MDIWIGVVSFVILFNLNSNSIQGHVHHLSHNHQKSGRKRSEIAQKNGGRRSGIPHKSDKRRHEIAQNSGRRRSEIAQVEGAEIDGGKRRDETGGQMPFPDLTDTAYFKRTQTEREPSVSPKHSITSCIKTCIQNKQTTSSRLPSNSTSKDSAVRRSNKSRKHFPTAEKVTTDFKQLLKSYNAQRTSTQRLHAITGEKVAADFKKLVVLQMMKKMLEKNKDVKLFKRSSIIDAQKKNGKSTEELSSEFSANPRDELVRNAVNIAKKLSTMEGDTDRDKRRKVMINVRIRPKYLNGKLTEETKRQLVKQVTTAMIEARSSLHTMEESTPKLALSSSGTLNKKARNSKSSESESLKKLPLQSRRFLSSNKDEPVSETKSLPEGNNLHDKPSHRNSAVRASRRDSRVESRMTKDLAKELIGVIGDMEDELGGAERSITQSSMLHVNGTESEEDIAHKRNNFLHENGTLDKSIEKSKFLYELHKEMLETRSHDKKIQTKDSVSGVKNLTESDVEIDSPEWKIAKKFAEEKLKSDGEKTKGVWSASKIKKYHKFVRAIREFAKMAKNLNLKINLDHLIKSKMAELKKEETQGLKNSSNISEETKSVDSNDANLMHGGNVMSTPSNDSTKIKTGNNSTILGINTASDDVENKTNNDKGNDTISNNVNLQQDLTKYNASSKNVNSMKDIFLISRLSSSAPEESQSNSNDTTNHESKQDSKYDENATSEEHKGNANVTVEKDESESNGQVDPQSKENTMNEIKQVQESMKNASENNSNDIKQTPNQISNSTRNEQRLSETNQNQEGNSNNVVNETVPRNDSQEEKQSNETKETGEDCKGEGQKQIVKFIPILNKNCTVCLSVYSPDTIKTSILDANNKDNLIATFREMHRSRALKDISASVKSKIESIPSRKIKNDVNKRMEETVPVIVKCRGNNYIVNIDVKVFDWNLKQITEEEAESSSTQNIDALSPSKQIIDDKSVSSSEQDMYASKPLKQVKEDRTESPSTQSIGASPPLVGNETNAKATDESKVQTSHDHSKNKSDSEIVKETKIGGDKKRKTKLKLHLSNGVTWEDHPEDPRKGGVGQADISDGIQDENAFGESPFHKHTSHRKMSSFGEDENDNDYNDNDSEDEDDDDEKDDKNDRDNEEDDEEGGDKKGKKDDEELRYEKDKEVKYDEKEKKINKEDNKEDNPSTKVSFQRIKDSDAKEAKKLAKENNPLGTASNTDKDTSINIKFKTNGTDTSDLAGDRLRTKNETLSEKQTSKKKAESESDGDTKVNLKIAIIKESKNEKSRSEGKTNESKSEDTISKSKNLGSKTGKMKLNATVEKDNKESKELNKTKSMEKDTSDSKPSSTNETRTGTKSNDTSSDEEVTLTISVRNENVTAFIGNVTAEEGKLNSNKVVTVESIGMEVPPLIASFAGKGDHAASETGTIKNQEMNKKAEKTGGEIKENNIEKVKILKQMEKADGNMQEKKIEVTKSEKEEKKLNGNTQEEKSEQMKIEKHEKKYSDKKEIASKNDPTSKEEEKGSDVTDQDSKLNKTEKNVEKEVEGRNESALIADTKNDSVSVIAKEQKMNADLIKKLDDAKEGNSTAFESVDTTKSKVSGNKIETRGTNSTILGENNEKNGTDTYKKSNGTSKTLDEGTQRSKVTHTNHNATSSGDSSRKGASGDKSSSDPVETSFKSFCSRRSTGMYPNINDCTKYWICAGNKTFPASCPQQLVYNYKLRSCDFMKNLPPAVREYYAYWDSCGISKRMKILGPEDLYKMSDNRPYQPL